jgi:hypothetical protein
MAFKMKRKGFPMKGESPNKIRDYTSAMDMKKEESPAKRAGSYTYDVDELTGKEIVKRIPTQDLQTGGSAESGFVTGPDIDKTMKSDMDREIYKQNLKNIGKKRGKHGYLEGQLTEMADVFGLSDEFPGNPKARREAVGMSREEEARKIDEEIQRKVNAGEPLTEQEAKYNKMIEDYYTRKRASDSPAEMKSGFKMKSPAKKLDIDVTRGGKNVFYDMDIGSRGGSGRVKNVTDVMKNYEAKNKNIIQANREAGGYQDVLDQQAKIKKKYLDQGMSDYEAVMAINEDPAWLKLENKLEEIDKGNFEGGMDLFDVKYSGKDAEIRDKIDRTGTYTTSQGFDANVPNSEELMEIDSYTTLSDDNLTAAEEDQLMREQKYKRQQAANSAVEMKKQKSPIEMKRGFKMKGNPYKMGKMQTASAVKMAKEAMAKMKKEESAMDMKYKSPAKAAKPDYIDIDGDGNKEESMKKAAADKKAGPNKLKRATKEERARMAKGDKKMTPEMMEALKKRGKEMKGKTPGTGMRKMSAADRKELENLGKKSGTKMKKEDSPNKLKKPTRKKMLMDTTKKTPKMRTGKMSTAEEASRMEAKGKAVAKMKKEDSPNKKYKSAAQRKAVHASKADGGKGNPNKMKKKND